MPRFDACEALYFLTGFPTFQVTGKATGIPVVAAVNTGALTAASSATSAASQMAQDIAKNSAAHGSQRRWTISAVQMEGFGDTGGNDRQR
ncbi:hypothetical protein DID96_27295 [Burkholderia sp. Bp8963]|uniref:hypothetical protein n=1 Tax=Burkholderia sp. Bp8963 TaxID=2184547 RepID=UPI000F5947E5|nr:hypothetical protein [Burkholderia sp. Bp8963]RQS65144.1 hypothetical protein DID96_27295 [Burkholderia sp. Bp8963]